jgi:hypothetical protein
MRTWTIRHLAATLTAVVFALPIYAAGPGHHDPKPVEHGVQPWMHVGDQIRRSSVEGYQFSYHLLALEEKKVAGRGKQRTSKKWPDPDHEATHHLMLFLMDPDGKMVMDIGVGFTVKGPDGVEQEPQVTLMTGGFGVNVDLNAKGLYEVRTRIVAGGKEIVDEFRYEVK